MTAKEAGAGGGVGAAPLACLHDSQGSCPAVGLVDVFGLVVANAASHVAKPERQALRLVCRNICDVLDAAILPSGLTVWADRLAEGAAGAQQLERYLARPGCCPPASLTIRAKFDMTEQQL